MSLISSSLPPADFLTSAKDFLITFGELIGTLIIGVVIGVAGAIRRRKWSLRFDKKKDRLFVEQHTVVHEMLTELRVTVRASRCLIFQFHNGGSFADGTSIKRFSVTHESCENGVPSVLLDSQDVLLTRYMELVGVMDNRPSKIIKTSELSPSAFRSALEINNVEYFSVSPLRCLDGITPLGFVCCHWCTSDSLDEIEKEGISQSSLEQLISESVYTINTHLAHKTGKQ